MNSVRIVGGEFRRRVLRFPDSIGLRPTPDRVRETLFNWLGQDLDGWHCLDLFAGSGALGFEAASRGGRGGDDRTGPACSPRCMKTTNCSINQAEWRSFVRGCDTIFGLDAVEI